MDQPTLSLDRYVLLGDRNASRLRQYEDYVYNVVSAMGAADPGTARQDIQDMMDLEVKIAQVDLLS